MAIYTGTAGNDIITGTPDADFIRGNDGNDLLNGAGGHDTILGGAGNDTLIGDEGDDALRGEAGDDVMIGGNGSELFRGGAGVDYFDGGANDPDSTTFGSGSFGDRISFFELAAIAGVIADLRTGTISNDGFGNVETMVGIEGLGGDTAFADQFYGNDERNLLLGSVGDTLMGFGGDDVLQSSGAGALVDGGEGTDELNLATLGYLIPDANGDGIAETNADMTAGWRVDLAAQTLTDGFGATGTVRSVEIVNGTQYDDQLLGSVADETLRGFEGNDFIDGRGGNDALDGGEGSDTIFGGGGDDVITGGAGDDVLLNGGGGSDVIEGGDGNDILIGGFGPGGGPMPGDGADTLRGGLGDDLLRGGEGDDVLEGGDGGDNLRGDAGNDVLDGGEGRDFVSYRFDHLSSGVTVDARQFGAAASFAWADGLGGTDQVSNVEMLGITGSQGHDTLHGSLFVTGGAGIGYANQIYGAFGDDEIHGAGSVDFLSGDEGNDRLFGGDGSDDVLGGSGDDMLSGDGGDDYLEGGAGNDAIDGGAGFDEALFNGDSDDYDIVRLADGSIRVSSADTGVDVLTNVEVITIYDVAEDGEDAGEEELTRIDLTQPSGFVGTLGNDSYTGTAGADVAYASDGNDTLRGGEGDDYLVGGAGDDRFDELTDGRGGGLGRDVLLGGAGNDIIFDFFGANEIEGGDGNDTLGGTGFILGGNGNDTIIYLSSGPSTDRVDGEGGNDVYIVYPAIEADWTADIIVNFEVGNTAELISVAPVVDQLVGYAAGGNLYAGGFLRYIQVGADAVLQVDFDGAAGPGGFSDLLILENINLDVARPALQARTGLLANVGGNRDANSLGGGAGNDFIRAFAGNDTINANDGNDFVEGGLGDDFINGGNGDDNLNGDAGYELTGGNDNINGGTGNDILNGHLGDDNLRGGDGNDRLIGGGGTDLFRGNAGIDSFDGGDSDPASNTFGTGSGVYGDRISFFEVTAMQGVVADLRTGVISNDGFGNTETMVGIESLGGDTAFADEFYGNEERNLLLGSRGDTLMGFGGDDALQSSGAGALVDGGDGFDVLNLTTVGYSLPDANGDGIAETGPAMTAGWTVDLGAQRATDGFGDSGVVRNIEEVNGTELADTLSGAGANETLRGLAGDDTLFGRGGADTLEGGDGNDALIGGFHNGGAPQPGDGADTLRGGNGDDVLRGGDGDDVLEGGEGGDNLRGDAGNDVLDGGEGRDFVSYRFDHLTTGVTIDARQFGATTSFAWDDGLGGTDQVSNVEMLGISGSQGADTLHGSEFTIGVAGSHYGNQIYGFGGDDTIHGAGSVDILAGDDGNDRIFGGDDSDDVLGGSGDDLLSGDGGDDYLEGGAGNDAIDGGDGTDLATFYFAPDTLGSFSTVAGTGTDAGKLLVVRTHGAVSETVAEITAAGSVLTVTGVGSAAYLGTDTVINVEKLLFSTLPADPSTQPTTPGFVEVDVATTTGIVSDGYVAGATVFVDNNRNGVLDAGEASAVTDANGDFELLTFGGGPIVALGGVNTDTGLANEVALVAPTGSTVINPLTTLVQAVVDSGVSAAAAEAQVKAALGLDAGIDLLDADLIALTAGGDAAALEAQQAAAIVVSIIAAAKDIDGDAEAALVGELAAAVTAAAAGGGTVDLTDSAVIESVLTEALPDAGDLGSAAETLAAGAAAIDATTSLEALSEAQAAAMLTGNDLDNRLVSGEQGDRLTGLGGDDRLFGNGGADELLGGDGDDVLEGGDGFDRLFGGAGDDLFAVGAGPEAIGKAGIAYDVVFDFDAAGGDVLALIDATLLRTQSFGNVNAAEQALGVELDGLTKHADPKAFVTVAFADANGDGVADFGVALIGVKALGAGDVLSNQVEPLPDPFI